MTCWIESVDPVDDLCLTNQIYLFIAPAGISPPRGGTLVARAYIKDSTYSTNMQSVYRKNLDLLEQGSRGIGR